MKYIVIPEQPKERMTPAFYFAVEEYVANHFTDDEYFFVWCVPPTLMVGRNQLVANEVNMDYCREHGIGVFRRKSGGGCVFADAGCLQFSYPVKAEKVEETFRKYMGTTASVLQQAGIPAEVTGRNDILIDGMKVAGAAFYTAPHRNIMHNTLLFSSDLDVLRHCIATHKEKLPTKGVASQRKVVTNVGDYTRMTKEELVSFARQKICGDEARTLTQADMDNIGELEKVWKSKEFIFGNDPSFTLVRKHRFPEVGLVTAYLEIKNGLIESLTLTGDYFPLQDLSPIAAALRRVRFEREAVEAALGGLDASAFIRGMGNAKLLRLLFGREPHVAKPAWLRTSMLTNQHFGETQSVIRHNSLHTICESGLCPNRNECWRLGTATFMIGGDICTRHCRFCNTLSGRPRPLDALEPLKVAQSVRQMKLRYAVITSVDRDDLPDYGAGHWIETVREIKRLNPATGIELLIPDFGGDRELIGSVLETRPNVVGHNMETVRRLTPEVRSVATYARSLAVLSAIAEAGVRCKTGMMLGLGETEEEVLQAMDDILATGCSILTLGQYLQPTAHHLPVREYISPQRFAEYRKTALAKGFKYVESGPLVRSSYHAESVLRGE